MRTFGETEASLKPKQQTKLRLLYCNLLSLCYFSSHLLIISASSREVSRYNERLATIVADLRSRYQQEQDEYVLPFHNNTKHNLQAKKTDKSTDRHVK